jgi:hypothetical protein
MGFSTMLQLVGTGLAGALFPETALLPPLFAALATLLLGFALTRIPLRVEATPLSYPLLVVLFALVTAGSLLALLPSWTVLGQTLTLGCWLMALRTLWWKLKWVPKRLSRIPWIQFGLLAAVAAVLAGLTATQLLFPPQINTVFTLTGLALTLAGGWLLALGPGTSDDHPGLS